MKHKRTHKTAGRGSCWSGEGDGDSWRHSYQPSNTSKGGVSGTFTKFIRQCVLTITLSSTVMSRGNKESRIIVANSLSRWRREVSSVKQWLSGECGWCAVFVCLSVWVGAPAAPKVTLLDGSTNLEAHNLSPPQGLPRSTWQSIHTAILLPGMIII